MNRNTCTAVHVPTHLECQVCYDTWTHPVQLRKCGHIFCRNCVPPTTPECVVCRTAVTGFVAPSDGVCEASMNVPVMCSSCGWQGTRKASLSHQCDSCQTHSSYRPLPAMTDSEWVALALEERNGAASAGAGHPVHQSALPVHAAISADTMPGIPL
ncbi:Zinc finger, C3HC4 type (RING finger) containing protein [Novymonas esmeraldas]|uniref:Zinc finger, C3HC4 type (RING finger) containing protein n=1 Tax=Novymonas esmeraldas TaxID=1808958 RepID=A0AAW0ERP7_9TRYP